MCYFLEMTYCGQHRKHCLYNHSHIPRASLAHFHILRITRSRVKADVGQHYHSLVKLFYQRMKLAVMHIGSGSCPTGYKAKLVEQKAELASHDPTMIRFAFLADLMRAASFPNGVKKLDTESVSHTLYGCFGQKQVCPFAVSLEEAKQAGALRQVREKMEPIAFDPSIESPCANTLDSKQPQRARATSQG